MAAQRWRDGLRWRARTVRCRARGGRGGWRGKAKCSETDPRLCSAGGERTCLCMVGGSDATGEVGLGPVSHGLDMHNRNRRALWVGVGGHFGPESAGMIVARPRAQEPRRGVSSPFDVDSHRDGALLADGVRSVGLGSFAVDHRLHDVRRHADARPHVPDLPRLAIVDVIGEPEPLVGRLWLLRHGLGLKHR